LLPIDNSLTSVVQGGLLDFILVPKSFLLKGSFGERLSQSNMVSEVGSCTPARCAWSYPRVTPSVVHSIMGLREAVENSSTSVV